MDEKERQTQTCRHNIQGKKRRRKFQEKKANNKLNKKIYNNNNNYDEMGIQIHNKNDKLYVRSK